MGVEKHCPWRLKLIRAKKRTAHVIVGLPDAAVKESINRVSSAMANSGFVMPMTKMTVNLAPGDIKKEGPIYDLPISLGIIASTGNIDDAKLRDFVIAGELSLSGELRSICGGVSLALLARRQKKRGVILPPESAAEAALVEGVEVYSAKNLRELVDFFNGRAELKPILAKDSPVRREFEDSSMPDFRDVKGQQAVRRAVEVAVAGGHNLLMVGPPGSGKSMIAKRIPSIMPTPTLEEFLEILGIYSAAGLTQTNEHKCFRRPFRSPHHSISKVGLSGGGPNPKPGKFRSRTNGVLFSNELPEFGSILDNLRQPIEDGKITISRAAQENHTALQVYAVAAMNPCKCGAISATPAINAIARHSKSRTTAREISGPLLDRIRHTPSRLVALPCGGLAFRAERTEPSAEIRKRVIAARKIQSERFSKSGKVLKINAMMETAEIRKFCELDDEQASILSAAMEELNLSARAWDRILKVSRTIADLDFSEKIETNHLFEAINYRSLDRTI